MKLLVTGLNGTVAPKLAALARASGAEVVGWNREAADPSEPERCRSYLAQVAPDAIAHLAFGAESWAGLLAAHAREADLPFVFTSTVMVFGDSPNGPHYPTDRRSGTDDYGLYKGRCEDAVFTANPGAMVARLGWQIHEDGQGNNMLRQLDTWQAEKGGVDASRLWIPACSFMDDTAAALWRLLTNRVPGVHHVDANAEDAWTFDRLVFALKSRLGRDSWTVRVNSDYQHDQRLAGSPGLCRSLSDRLD